MFNGKENLEDFLKPMTVIHSGFRTDVCVFKWTGPNYKFCYDAFINFKCYDYDHKIKNFKKNFVAER